MKSLEIPEDLKEAPYEMKRDFIEQYNKGIADGVKDSEMFARKFLLKKYKEKE